MTSNSFISSFIKIPLFSKDLLTYKKSFIPLFVKVSLELLSFEILPFIDFFKNQSTNLIGKDVTLYNSGGPKIRPNCIILDNWVFEYFILADEQFASFTNL